MAEDKEDSKAALLTSARRLVRSKKAYWWIPFVFIFIFLLGGGFYATSVMRESAHQLGGGANYAKFTSNNDVYEGRATVPRSENFFASDEVIASAPREGDKKTLDLKASDFSAAQPPVAASGAGGEGPGGAASAAAPMPGRSDFERLSMAGKLQARGGMPGGMGGGGGSKTSGQARIGGFNEGGTTASVGRAGGPAVSGGGAKGAGGGVLDSLKGAFRASFYGARIASQDSAKDWTARSFDATPEATTAIQYNDNMRTALDKVNPNSIPNFLREQEVSADGATTLTNSKVSAPSAVKTEEKAEEKKPGDQLMSGMLNSIFSGLFSGGNNANGANGANGSGDGTDKNQMNGLSDPNSDPSTRSVDEFGYISYGDPNGMQYVYSPDGSFMGCTDNQAGWSIPAGSPGCSR